MIDTGFSGYACVSENFVKVSHKFLKHNPSKASSKVFFSDDIWAIPKTSHKNYVFGNGTAVSDRQCGLQLGPLRLTLDVIPDPDCNIPILLGRKFLSQFAAKIDFSENSEPSCKISFQKSTITMNLVTKNLTDVQISENSTSAIGGVLPAPPSANPKISENFCHSSCEKCRGNSEFSENLCFPADDAPPQLPQYIKPKALSRTLCDRYPTWRKLWNLSALKLWKLHANRHSPTASILATIEAGLGGELLLDGDVQKFLGTIKEFLDKCALRCRVCIQAASRASFPPLLKANLPAFNSRVVADVMHHGALAFLLILDVATSFVSISVLRGSITGQLLADALALSWISIFGPPSTCIFDREFASAQQALEVLGCVVYFRPGAASQTGGQVERAIQTARRGLASYDFSRLSSIETDLFACYLSNALNNEIRLKGSSPALRVFGFSTSVSVNSLSDSSNSAFTSPSHIREQAMHVFREATSSKSLREVLSTKQPDVNRIIPAGEHIFFFRKRPGSKTEVQRHSGVVLLYDTTQQQYHISTSKGELIFVSPRDISLKSDDMIDVYFPNIGRKPANFDVPPEPVVCVRCNNPNSKKPHHSNCPRSKAYRQQQQVPALATADESAVGGQQHAVTDQGAAKKSGNSKKKSRNSNLSKISENKNPNLPDLSISKNPDLPDLSISENPSLISPTENNQHQLYETSVRDAQTTCNTPDDATDKAHDAEYVKMCRQIIEEREQQVRAYRTGEGMEDAPYSPMDFPIELLSADEVGSLLEYGMPSSEISKYQLSWNDLTPKQKAEAVRDGLRPWYQYGVIVKGDEKSLEEFKKYKVQKPEIVELDGRSVTKAKFGPLGEVIGKWRLTARGYKDRQSDSSESDSPTVSQLTIMICEFIGLRMAMLFAWVVASLDFSDAFFRITEIEHTTERWIRMPSEATGGRTLYYQLHKEVQGEKGAGRSWHATLHKLLVQFGFTQCRYDLSCFILWRDGALRAVLPVHVDDSRVWGERSVLDELKAFLLEKFGSITWNELQEVRKGTLDFNGIDFHTDLTGEVPCTTLKQNAYIDAKLHPIVLPAGYSKDDDRSCPELLKQFQSALGSLLWVALKTQKHVGFEASFLSSQKNNLQVGHIKRLNKVIAGVKAKPVEPKLFGVKDYKIVGICDGGLTGSRGQCAYAVGLMSATKPGVAGVFVPLHVRTQKCPRVCHNSFDVESITAICCLDMVTSIGFNLDEFENGPDRATRTERRSFVHARAAQRGALLSSAEVHTDSMSFVRGVRSTLQSKQFASQRRRDDVQDFRESIARQELCDVYHILGPTNPLDAISKPMEKCTSSIGAFMSMMQGFYEPQFS